MTSTPRDGAMPHRAEQTPKAITAPQNTRTAPNRDASQPDRGTVMASATE